MSRVRDDRRRNNRQRFALHHDNGDRVGSYWLTEVDGCEARYLDGVEFERAVSVDHEPGTHLLIDTAGPAS